MVTARQRKLKHLLVLLARVSFISFLVFLFAQPFIPAPEQRSQQGAVNVLVDNSASMQQVGVSDHLLVEDAIQEASELPLAFSSGARFALVGNKQGVGSGEAYRAAVQAIQITGQNLSVNAQLSQGLDQAARTNGPLFLFSDFQKNNFSQQQLTSLDSSQQVFLVPLAGKATANVFVDSVWLDDAFVRANTDITLRVRLRNGGAQTSTDCPVKVFVGKQQAAVFRVPVPAHQTTTSMVKVRLTDKWLQECRVEVEDSPVDFDNTYYFTLQPAAQIRVVEVANEGLMAQLYNNEPLFTYQHLAPRTGDYRGLERANLILLREATEVSAGLREKIQEAVQRGATIVIVPAATASHDSYTALFRTIGVGAVQWEPTKGGVPPLRDVAAPNRQNPFFQDVFAGQNRPAVMPKAAPVLSWSRSGTEILRLRDGDDFLAGFSSGKGVVYLFASPFSNGYSDFTRHALFVPVMYRLAMQSYQQEQQPAYRLNQRTLSVRLPDAISTGEESIFKLTSDSAEYIPSQRVQGARVVLDIPPGMRTPGFYTLTRAGQPVLKMAFNFDKHESDLTSYSAAELKQLIGPNRPNIRVYETGGGQSVAAQYKATRVGVPLWRYCLLGALLCLLAEGILLRVRGRQKVASVAQAA